MQDGDHPQYLSDAAISAMTINVFQAYLPSFKQKDFEDTMRSYGFTDAWDLQLLTARYYHKQSSETIAKNLNYVSSRTTRRRLQHLRALLKERKPKKDIK